MHEMTFETSGQIENDPSMWPSDEEMRQLATESCYCFEDYYYVRRYLTLKQMDTLNRVAASSASSFPAVAVGYINCLA